MNLQRKFPAKAAVDTKVRNENFSYIKDAPFQRFLYSAPLQKHFLSCKTFFIYCIFCISIWRTAKAEPVQTYTDTSSVPKELVNLTGTSTESPSKNGIP